MKSLQDYINESIISEAKVMDLDEYKLAAKEWTEFCKKNYKSKSGDTTSMDEFNASLTALFNETEDVAKELMDNHTLKDVLDFDSWDVLEEDGKDFDDAQKFWKKNRSKFFKF
jgi:hypothetical protein